MSVVTTILSIILAGIAIWQFKEGQKQEDRIKAQVKVWMQDANGISQGMKRIISDNLAGRYGSTNDVCNAVWSLEATAFALYQGLYEERCVKEDEYIQRQKKIMDKLDKQFFADTPAIQERPVEPGKK